MTCSFFPVTIFYCRMYFVGNFNYGECKTWHLARWVCYAREGGFLLSRRLRCRGRHAHWCVQLISTSASHTLSTGRSDQIRSDQIRSDHERERGDDGHQLATTTTRALLNEIGCFKAAHPKIWGRRTRRERSRAPKVDGDRANNGPNRCTWPRAMARSCAVCGCGRLSLSSKS